MKKIRNLLKNPGGGYKTVPRQQIYKEGGQM